MKKLFEEPDFLDHLHQKVKEMCELFHRPADEIIMDDVDLRNMLKISRRTALNYRKSGKLKFYQKEGKIYYFLSDVLAFIKNS